MSDDIEAQRTRLANLKIEHQDLDVAIANLADNKPYAQLEMQRLKKRKLRLKDQIAALENQLLPDIIA